MVVRVAVVEEREEGVVGGVLRAAPVPSFCEDLRDVCPGEHQFSLGREIEVVMATDGDAGCELRRRVAAFLDESLGVGQAIPLTSCRGLASVTTPLKLTITFCGGDDQVVVRVPVTTAHEASIDTTLVGPFRANGGDSINLSQGCIPGLFADHLKNHCGKLRVFGGKACASCINGDGGHWWLLKKRAGGRRFPAGFWSDSSVGYGPANRLRRNGLNERITEG